MSEDKKRSLIVSTLGTNAFYIPYCEVEKYSPNYAACLCRADKMKEDARYKKSWANCADAIQNGVCEAQKLRAQEIEAGECLFFVQRTNSTTAPIPKSDISVPSPIATEEKPAKKKWVNGLLGDSSSRTGFVSTPKPKTADKKGGLFEFDGFDKVIDRGAAGKLPEVSKEREPIIEVKQPMKSISADSPLAIALKLKQESI